jgi:glutamate carboxypeptidase
MDDVRTPLFRRSGASAELGAISRTSPPPSRYWPVGQLADAMPWREADGIIHGPGVFDMKGGLVVLETALEQVADQDHRPVRVVVVADEEIGSPSARSLVTTEAAGVYAAFGLEPPHPNGDLKTSRWGSTRVRIEITGREAHAALDPDSGVSAIDELVDQLIAVRRIVAQYREVLCNVGTITGGGRTNVVHGSASTDIGSASSIRRPRKPCSRLLPNCSRCEPLS